MGLELGNILLGKPLNSVVQEFCKVVEKPTKF
jgi:hypothetical protein